jgi:regulatory protein
MRTTEKINTNHAISRLKQLCSRSEKSELDIRKKLGEWQLEDQADKIISILKNEKFIDNVRYAKAFAIDKMRFNKWGKYKIRIILRSKEIPDFQINEAISSIDEEEYRKMVFSELEKKKKSLKKAEPFIVKAKIFAFGSQRGYESEIINDFLS